MNDFMKTKAEKKMKFDEIMLKGTSNSPLLVTLKKQIMAEKKTKQE